MKMKEVCAQTGLTERAVRFYVQEKLVVPLAQRRGGRTWLDFSPADVDRLKAISTLRKAGFTLEEIRSMITDFSKNASGAAFALRQRLQAAIDAYDKLRFTDTAQANGLEDYAALLEREVKGRPIPESDRVHGNPDGWFAGAEAFCMVWAVYFMFRLYVFLLDHFSDYSALLQAAAWNPLVFVLLFVVIPLPIALVLGSKAGKWICRHLEYIP
ncbi:MerR family transcriptional regulator [uncultured Flavonifractor sp.]|uniref:MerR family transcriptional regulator n=1 Tax=Candidatus Flavonifractor intestinigallinarum TaxID=2838586 RepID=A0A9D2MPA8_9FIRM|nr:MerR family transcriptional regulator [uncultured Flavonifractor sp.]HJB81208.1 MerR family transcriptional regulator [Candidatus Flavonifractor intestinigallinarum]